MNYILRFLVAFIILIMTSCGSRKEVVLFNQASDEDVQTEYKSFTPTLKVDDFISVIVMAEDPESAIPFNFPDLGMRVPINYGYTSGTPIKTGYLVDEDGNIDLPVIGTFNIAGLTRLEATSKLKEIYKQYLKEPVVNIQIQNYKVTVLGDVTKPGTFLIPNERITIFEAIGLSGDLRITGKRVNVLVIREEDGMRKEYRVDLTKKEILNSPVYYLQQNDVVYVEPNITARSQAAFWRSTGGLFISLTSLIITTAVLITNNN